MGESGGLSAFNYVWDSDNTKWVKQVTSSTDTTRVSGVETSDFVRIVSARDLVTTIQYNESDLRTTVSGITYTSVLLGRTATETFVSGTNFLTITRSCD